MNSSNIPSFEIVNKQNVPINKTNSVTPFHGVSQEDISKDRGEEDGGTQVTCLRKVSVFFCLIIIILLSSLNSVWYVLLADSPAIMRVCWKLTITWLCFLSVRFFTIEFTDSIKKDIRKYLLRLCITSFIFSLQLSCFSLSLNLTSSFHVLVVMCLTPLFSILLFHIKECLPCNNSSQRINRMDTRCNRVIYFIFILTGFIGVLCLFIFCMTSINEYYGASLALFSSFLLSVQLEIIEPIRRKFPIWFFTFPMFIMASLFLFILSKIFEPSSVGFMDLYKSTDRYVYILGAAFSWLIAQVLINWISRYISHFILVIVLFAVEPIVACLIMYFAALQSISNLSVVFFLISFVIWISSLLALLGFNQKLFSPSQVPYQLQKDEDETIENDIE